ncbi:MAG: hypothetical protein JJE55_02580 [Flavobacteriaceae bacterium]|nr:hypothetical protein [Flavobacteriaceae bacterium]
MCGTKPTKITLTIGARTDKPYPPSLEDDNGFTSITEPGDQKTVTLVSPGNIMIWKMSGDITKIIAVVETGGDDVFSINPTLQPDGTWQAVVGNFPPGNEKSYSIVYAVSGATCDCYCQDPVMKIKPTQTV